MAAAAGWRRVVQTHKWKLLLGGTAVYVGVAAATYQLTRPAPPAAADAPSALGQGRSAGIAAGSGPSVFDRMAPTYDSDIGMDEVVMGLPLLRRMLMKNASGRVLEVSAGTGRNLKYLAKAADIEELTVTDVSSVMVDSASRKATDLHLTRRMPVVLRKMSATQLAFRDGTFDTVVDTFGLCSCEDPKKALSEMARVCRPDGRILLLEHGRSHYSWLSSILDKHAPKHAERWGCWWNRDIMGMVEQAGLQLETVRRFHFGTTCYIIARPAKAATTSTPPSEPTAAVSRAATSTT